MVSTFVAPVSYRPIFNWRRQKVFSGEKTLQDMLLRVVYYGDEEDKIWDRELLLYLFVTCQALVSFHFFLVPWISCCRRGRAK